MFGLCNNIAASRNFFANFAVRFSFIREHGIFRGKGWACAPSEVGNWHHPPPLYAPRCFEYERLNCTDEEVGGGVRQFFS